MPRTNNAQDFGPPTTLALGENKIQTLKDWKNSLHSFWQVAPVARTLERFLRSELGDFPLSGLFAKLSVFVFNKEEDR